MSHHQKMSLPPKLDLNDAQNNFNSKISLGLNDAFIPMSVIANSFGTGNYIKMKIVDKVNFSVKNCTKRLLASSGVSKAVLVEDESSLEDKYKTDKSTAPSEVTEGKYVRFASIYKKASFIFNTHFVTWLEIVINYINQLLYSKNYSLYYRK